MAKKTTSSVSPPEPRLFGIAKSNRAHSQMWGKNCFNSAFPTALACYMRTHGLNPVYICADNSGANLTVDNKEISVNQVFNISKDVCNEELFFSFETKFLPYFCHLQEPSELDGADLVIQHDGEWLRALQIKLTVVPDDGTSKENQKEWAPELVLRPADTCSCALGIYAGVSNRASEVEKIFRTPCAEIQHWNNDTEISQKKSQLLNCVEKFLYTFCDLQQPYLLHSIWMTEGKNPVLASNAFDIFVWSDYALMTAYLRQANAEAGGAISRATRAVVRFARTQYELASSAHGKIRVRPIYREMDFGRQTDKEMAMSGKMTRKYMTSLRRVSPILPPDILKHIILNGGHEKLSPERRFDQTVYFTAQKYFNNKHYKE